MFLCGSNETRVMKNRQYIENEKSVIQRVSEGDAQAFRVLYLHYYNRLYQFAMLFLRSEEASEDVVEDVFFFVWKSRQKLPSIANFNAYIYLSVRNGCLNLLKSSYISKRNAMPEMEIQVGVLPDSPLDELLYNELNTAVKQAVNSLPERCRLIFKMAKEDEMSHGEIAEILHVKVCTVDRQLLLAKNKIREYIRPFLEKE